MNRSRNFVGLAKRRRLISLCLLKAPRRQWQVDGGEEGGGMTADGREVGSTRVPYSGCLASATGSDSSHSCRDGDSIDAARPTDHPRPSASPSQSTSTSTIRHAHSHGWQASAYVWMSRGASPNWDRAQQCRTAKSNWARCGDECGEA